MSTNVVEEIRFLFEAAIPVVAVESPAAEEVALLEMLVSDVAIPLNCEAYSFDLGRGLRQLTISDGGLCFEELSINFQTDPLMECLDWIEQTDKEAMICLLDVHHFLSGDKQDLLFCRKLKNLTFALQQSNKRIAIIGQDIRLPDDFEGLVEQVQNYLPEPFKIRVLLDAQQFDLETRFAEERKPFTSDSTAETKFKIVRSCQGLSEQEILKAVKLSALKYRQFGEKTVMVVGEYKLNKLRKLGVEIIENSAIQVGGLENLKTWFEQRTKLFNSQIESTSKLPPPKGILLVGLPGTGKSLCAKTIGALWGVPIMRFDMGTMFSSLVGESEANMRRMLQVAESIAPAVLLVDEIDKAFAAASGPSTDSGVGMRLFGTFLTWMQEKTKPVFVVATANNIAELPPELSRKGRFDEVFWVDLPTQAERMAILQIHLTHYEISFDPQEIQQISKLTPDWSGAELEQLVKDALIVAEFEDRPVTLKDFEILASEQLPLASREASKIALLREWGAKSARPASLRLETSSQKQKTTTITKNANLRLR